MTPLQTAVILFPTTSTGRTLRAFLRLSPERTDKFTGWRGRLALLRSCGRPVLLLALLAAEQIVSRSSSPGEAGSY